MNEEELKKAIHDIIQKELEKLNENDKKEEKKEYGVGVPNPELIGRDENIEIDFDKYGYPDDDEPLFKVITQEEVKEEPKHTKEELDKIKELFDTYNKYTDLLNYFNARSIGDVISKYTE